MRALTSTLLVALASYRATRLVTLDTIGDSWRRRWYHRFDPERHPLGQLVSCSWCIGWWLTGAVTLAVWLVLGLVVPLLVWPAATVIVGFLGKLDDL